MGARHGFSLLEVLIAILILGIGIMAIMQLFPPSLYQARLSTERLPTAARADKEFGVLRAWGLSPSPAEDGSPVELAWPLTAETPVANAWGEAYLQYNIQALGIPAIERASCIYSLYRVTLAVPMMDGRYEKFVTYISNY